MTNASKLTTLSLVKKKNDQQPVGSRAPLPEQRPPAPPTRKLLKKLKREIEKTGKKKLPVQLQDQLVSVLEAKEQLQLLRILSFQGIFSDEDIQRVAVKFVHNESRDRLFDPTTTLWVFLTQILDYDHSCRGAVARYLAFVANKGRKACSLNTGSYCKARMRLPEGMISDLTRHAALTLEKECPRHWLWKERSINLVDGTTLCMPDTPSLQKSFPQPKSQKRELDFQLQEPGI